MISIAYIHEMLKGEDTLHLKYVRTSTEYRFTGLHGDHRTLIKEDEDALSAGMVHVDPLYPETFTVSGESMSLHKRPLADDADNIKKLFWS